MQPILPPIDNNFMVFAALAFNVLSASIIPIFLIPLQVKQAGVKNGLGKLRKQMLTKGLIGELVALVSLYFIGLIALRIFQTGQIIGTLTQMALLLFSAGKFGNDFIDYLIYHQQYTPEHIALAVQSQKLINKRQRKGSK